MRKLIFLILITLFAAYAGWAERRPVGHYLSDLRSQVSVVQGQPGERGNLLAVQPELFTPDYQSAERLQLKFHAYLENARRQGLLNERTVVVFPEHVGTWLVASGEKPEVYAAAALAHGDGLDGREQPAEGGARLDHRARRTASHRHPVPDEGGGHGPRLPNPVRRARP